MDDRRQSGNGSTVHDQAKSTKAGDFVGIYDILALFGKRRFMIIVLTLAGFAAGGLYAHLRGAAYESRFRFAAWSCETEAPQETKAININTSLAEAFSREAPAAMFSGEFFRSLEADARRSDGRAPSARRALDLFVSRFAAPPAGSSTEGTRLSAVSGFARYLRGPMAASLKSGKAVKERFLFLLEGANPTAYTLTLRLPVKGLAPPVAEAAAAALARTIPAWNTAQRQWRAEGIRGPLVLFEKTSVDCFRNSFALLMEFNRLDDDVTRLEKKTAKGREGQSQVPSPVILSSPPSALLEPMEIREMARRIAALAAGRAVPADEINGLVERLGAIESRRTVLSEMRSDASQLTGYKAARSAYDKTTGFMLPVIDATDGIESLPQTGVVLDRPTTRGAVLTLLGGLTGFFVSLIMALMMQLAARVRAEIARSRFR